MTPNPTTRVPRTTEFGAARARSGVRNISIVKRLATLRHVTVVPTRGRTTRPPERRSTCALSRLLRPHTVTLFVTFAAVAAVVAAALVATGTGPPSVTFQEPGHWVYNRVERAAFHVDAGTRRVDARVDVPSSAGDPLMVLQDRRAGVRRRPRRRVAHRPRRAHRRCPAARRARRGPGRGRGRRRSVPGPPAGRDDRAAGRAAHGGGGRRPGGRPGPHRGRHGVGAPARHRRGVRPAQRGGDAGLRDPHRTGRGRGAHGRGRSPRLARHDRRHAVDRRRRPGRARAPT